METRTIGTVARAICAPEVAAGCKLEQVAADTLLAAAEQEGIILHSADMVGVDGTMLAKAQGNTLTVDQLAEEIREKYEGSASIGLLWPSFSTSAMAAILKSFARASSKLVLQLKYPQDESGRSLMSLESLFDMGVDPSEDTLDEECFLSLFYGSEKVENCASEYMDFCRRIVEAEGCQIQFLFSNKAQEILKYTRSVLYCHHHSSARLSRRLKDRGCRIFYTLGDLCTEEKAGRGFHPVHGLKGAVSLNADTILLAPRDMESFEAETEKILTDKIGCRIRVLVFSPFAEDDRPGMDLGPLCRLMGQSLSSSGSLVLLQGYRPQ